jgi:hypothetical protein
MYRDRVVEYLQALPSYEAQGTSTYLVIRNSAHCLSCRVGRVLGLHQRPAPSLRVEGWQHRLVTAPSHVCQGLVFDRPGAADDPFLDLLRRASESILQSSDAAG